MRDKELLLNSIRKKLKKQYRGINNQIDMLIDSITGWYLNTNIDDRPTIVNMWSITGLGKTSLIRTLMEYLKSADRLIEITLDNEATSEYKKTVLSRVNKAVGSNRDNLCLFIDEFQNMQTIDKDGKPVRNTPYQDLWTLLSDGRFFTKEDFIENIISTFDTICGYWISVHRNLGLVLDSLNKTNDLSDSDKVELELWKNRFNSFDTNYEHHVGAFGSNLIKIGEKMDDMLYTVGYTNEYTTEGVCDFVEKICKLTGDINIYQVYKVNTKFEYERIIKALRGSLFQHINFATYNDIINSYKEEAQRLAKSDVDSLLKAKNLLVIIAGNQDSLFEGSRDLVYTYKDVGELYDVNKKLRWFDLKQLLLEHIRPEQVSRLGMNHIIYPTLNESAYRQIIEDRLLVIKNNVLKKYNVELSFTDNIKNVIYRNGTFPTQGVRPLLSLVDSMIGSIIIELSSKINSNSATVDIDETNKLIVVYNKNKKLTKKILLEISDKEEDGNGKSRLRNAVHEAGHALVWMFTTGLPAEIDMAPISFTAGAWTRMKISDSIYEEIGNMHIFYKSKITTTLGGRMAEEYVFGEDNLSAGCWGDLEQATKRALDLIRACGYSSTTNNGIMTFVHPNDLNSPSMMTIDDDSIQKDAIMILNECKCQCMDILVLCKPILINMVEYLMNNVFMDVNTSKKFLNNINNIRNSVGIKPLKNFDSNKLWKKFIK